MERGTRQALLGVASLFTAAVAVAAAAMFLRPGADAGSIDFELSTQPTATVRLYHFAESHRDVISRIPCYCGCGKSLGHRSLSDCFVRPDGEGYDSHASACVICLDEAADVERLMADGKDTLAIRTWIEQEYGKYGPPTETD